MQEGEETERWRKGALERCIPRAAWPADVLGQGGPLQQEDRPSPVHSCVSGWRVCTPELKGVEAK